MLVHVHLASIQCSACAAAAGRVAGASKTSFINNSCVLCGVQTCVQVVENWYPGNAKDSKGVLLVVTAGKEGAISGGDKFLGVSNAASTAQRSTTQHITIACGWAQVAWLTHGTMGSRSALHFALCLCIACNIICLCNVLN